MISWWMCFCDKFLTLKGKSFIVRKIVGKTFLWKDQFILFCFCSSACMRHQVLVILEAGTNFLWQNNLAFFGVYMTGIYEYRPRNKCIFNEVLSVFFVVVFWQKKSAACFLIQSHNNLFLRFLFFLFSLFNVNTNPSRYCCFASVSII